MAIRTILCPVDFSECSERAIRYALSLAEQVGASEIRLLHAHAPVALSLPPGAHAGRERDESLRKYLARELESFARRYSGHGIAMVPQVVTGVPQQAILDAARDVDLIVMGTHGRGGAAHFLLGSVAEHVVAASTVPVCTVGLPEKSKRARSRRAEPEKVVS